MANNEKCHCSSGDMKGVGVQHLVLEDGRRAERHVCRDEKGNEVIEIYSEERRPLKLEKRVLREFKNVVAKETHQMLKDGEIVVEEVKPGEAQTQNDYVTRDEIGKLVAEGVVTGMQALMESMGGFGHETHPVPTAPIQMSAQQVSVPQMSAQSIVEGNVAEKKKNDWNANIILGVLFVAQLAFFSYMFFFM